MRADKVINCLGDSITYGANNNGISWADMLKQQIPSQTIKKYGVCGSTISLSAKRHDSFYERYKEMDMNYDLTILFGGVNDFNHSLILGQMGDRDGRTFYGALNHIIVDLLQINPIGELMCITPLKCSCEYKGYFHWNAKNECGHQLIDYRNAILEVAGFYSVPVLDLFSTSGITPDCAMVREKYLSDGLHPTNIGYERIARRVASFIKLL